MSAPTIGHVDNSVLINSDLDHVWDVTNDVENWPKEVIPAKDPQLDRAVEEAMKLLKAKPYDRMTTEPPSPTWGKRKGGGS